MSKLKKVGLITLLVGILCWIAFTLIGSTVDVQGMLHEPFALIPIGWLFVIIGAVLYLYASFKQKKGSL